VGFALAKAHAYGNDFLYLETGNLDRRDGPELARTLCARHTGAGADGLILYRPEGSGVAMRLYNADGSFSEVSGNGVRGLAALRCWESVAAGAAPPASILVRTDAGEKTVTILGCDPPRFVCRVAMGSPTGVRRVDLDAGGATIEAVVMRVGNPQCVLLEAVLDDARYMRLGPVLERHPYFPEGTNVEFAAVEHPGRVRILIWERGVGPTLASGTGACAAAVAAMAYGGAGHDVEVVSPGGTQRVEMLDAGLFLTGWAEVIWEGQWTR
jgi:diaminopimelate epimerase